MAIEPISQFHAKMGRYPGNNKQWWVARAESDDEEKGIKAGDFTPDILDKLYSGNNHAPRGHYILNAFYQDRSAVSGVGGLPIQITEQRPTSIAFFSGRVWYACNSTVYFSQVLTDKYKAGLCYQEADPTSEDISDLIATDGGVIPIPEANKIVKIIPNAGGILVFALNGVWNITGTSSGFSALDISVNKVSPVGCKSPMSIVETDTAVYWWSDIGILGMAQQSGMYGPIPGAFERTNVSELTIQTLYNDISEEAKEQVKGVFDAKANRILWLYRDSEVSSTQYNRVLILDLTLQAFYPWKFSELAGTFVKGLYVGERLNSIGNIDEVQSEGVQVTAGSDPVVVDIFTTDTSPSSIEYTVLNDGDKFRICQVSNTNFVDWESVNGVGVTYNSFIETGYELFNDAMRNKQITYIFTYLRRTEEEWINGPSGPELVDPSSCFMRVKWDWASSLVSNKWTSPVQVYRPTRLRFMPDDGEYDTGFPMVITKNKVRGNGKAIQFRFGTDERGRNFDLFGWSVAVTGNTIP